jgi:predicted N-acetyltransferase YhbS
MEREETSQVFQWAFNWEAPGLERHLLDAIYGGTFDPDHTRVTVADGRVVSIVVLAPRRAKFGPVTVPAMTVGPVGTLPPYCKKGLSAATMNNASQYMADNGYLLAYLQGIPDYYCRFGYYPYMAPGSMKVQRRDAAKEAAKGTLRKMTRADLPRVKRIYDAVTARRIMASDRDLRHWEWLLRHGSKTWFFGRPKVILNGRGSVCGYATTHPGNATDWRELVVKPDEASCRAALGALARESKRREAKELKLPLPWDSALAVFIRQFIGARVELYPSPAGGAMLKVVDFPALMRRLQPLFTERWRAARSSLRDVRFTLASDDGSVGFEITRNRVRVGDPGRAPRVRVPARWLSGLLTGYHTIADIASRKDATVPAPLMPYLDVLFPSGWPWVYAGDNY